MMDITPEESARMAAATGTVETQREMPRYQCHKKVWALKIEAVLLDSQIAHLEGRETDFSAQIVPSEAGFAPFKVSGGFVAKHQPQAGGYYVRYEDGYESYSPAKAFEEGYTRIP